MSDEAIDRDISRIMRKVAADPNDEAMCEPLVDLIIEGGVHKLHSTANCLQAAEILSNRHPLPAIRHVLLRVSIAGEQPPYDIYTGVKLFRRFLSGHPREVYRNTAYLMRLLSEDLIERAHAQHFVPCDSERFALAAKDFWRRCAEASCSAAPHVLLRSNFELKAILLPESSIRGEIVFMRVLQMQDVTFAAALGMAKAANRWIRFSEASSALTYIDFLERTSSHFAAPLRLLLRGLGTGDWRALRDFIEYPSAIQSPHPGELSMSLKQIERYLTHKRWQSRDSATVELCKQKLERAAKNLEAWTKAHTAIALHFNGRGLPGTDWMEEQTLAGTALFQRQDAELDHYSDTQ